MEEPAATAAPTATTTLLCVECGELIEVADPAAIMRALHLMNACGATAPILGSRE